MISVDWKNEITNLQTMVNEGFTAEKIAEKYNVCRPRIYQVLSKFNINTPEKKRNSFLQGKPPKYYWLVDKLRKKGYIGQNLIDLVNSIDIPDICPIFTDVKINYLGSGKKGWNNNDPSLPSIDQIIPGAGYVTGNIAIISYRANRIKNDGTAEEHKKISDWILKNTM